MPLFLLLDLVLHYLLLNFEAADRPNIARIPHAEKKIHLVVIDVQSAAQSSKGRSGEIVIDSHKLMLLDSKQLDASFVEFP